jgi:hypothetical protein
MKIQIPITNYDITLRDVYETIFGSIIIIFGLVGSIAFTNLIIGLVLNKNKYIDNRKINIFLLCVHIIFILLFVMMIIYISKQFIYNKLILESIFSFIGPIIGFSSLYLGYNIKILLNH